jgi:predicted ribosome quality control (RQC) complex YloA/Tae2 family protein
VIRHPFTLEHLARVLDREVRGGTIVEAWSQEKGTATMVVLKDDVLRTFHVDLGQHEGTVTERPSMRRARTNTVDVFGTILRQPIVMVTKHPDDRIITFWFPDAFLHIELFSGGRGNIVLVRNGTVVDALREKQDRVGTLFHVDDHVAPAPFMDPSMTIARSLAASDLRLGPHYANEVCARSGVDPATLCGAVTDDMGSRLLRTSASVIDACEGARTFHVLEHDGDVVFSLIPLDGWNTLRTTDDLMGAIRMAIIERQRRRQFEARRRSLLQTYEQALRRVERSIAGMTSDAAREGRSERYRHWADLLMAEVDGTRSGADMIAVVDPEGVRHEIPLVPTRTLIENAQALYEKARASAASARQREQRLPSLEKRRASLAATVERIRAATSPSDINDLDTTVTESSLPVRDEANGRFRVFVLDDDHTLYVGKNAANNDELTMRFAKQNDWWFHARGSAGSHAVLRGVSEPRIPKQILEKAAGITAYYSQARNASWVNVVYTQRKYVRKPKGANVGAVVLEREQTVMVKPWIPTEE